MKKLLLTYCAILIGVYVLFTLLDLKGDYRIEQQLWSVNQKYVELAKDPDVAPENSFDNLISKYQAVIDQNPDSDLIKGVYMLMGRTYIFKKDYEKAREVFAQIPINFPGNDELAAEAGATLAKTYEFENNWEKAEKAYSQVTDRYPLTSVGMSLPIYVANHYQTNNDYKGTLKSYNDAIAFYKRIVAEHPDSNAEFDGLRYLSNCYLAQNRWLEAVNTLSDVLIKYPTSEKLTVQRADLIIKTINTVVATQIGDYDVAINIYKGFIDKYPEHPLAPVLQKMIEGFNSLKEKDVKLSTAEE